MSVMTKIASIAAISAALSISAAQAKETTEKIGNWNVRHLVDKMNDSDRGVAFLIGSSGGSAVLKCDKRGDGVYVHFIAKEYMGETRRGDTRPFTYRIDKNAPIESGWRYLDRGAAEFDSNKTRQLARELLNAKTLLIRQYSFRFSPSDEEFDLAGASKAIPRVYELCGERL